MKLPYITGFILTAALLAFYVFQVNALVLEKFQVQSYQKKTEELQAINRDLQLRLTRVNYPENLAQKSRDMGFERTEIINYVQLTDEALAAKRP